MSMHNYACHGNLVEADKLANLLPDSKAALVKALLMEGAEAETIEEVFNEHLPSVYPRVSLICMDADVESEDVIGGEVYAFFNEDDLSNYSSESTKSNDLNQTTENGQHLSNLNEFFQ